MRPPAIRLPKIRSGSLGVEMRYLQPIQGQPLQYKRLIGTGGIGTGLFFKLEGDHTLGRNESRLGELVPFKDYCKLHIITHYIAVMLRADPRGEFRIYPIGRVGRDDQGYRLFEEMKQVGMSMDYVAFCEDAPTLYSVCFQYPDSTGGNITAANSASSRIDLQDIDACFKEKCNLQPEVFLAAPEAPLKSRLRLLAAGRERGGFNVASVLSSEVGEFSRLDGFSLVNLLAINIDEAGAIAGISGDRPPSQEIVARCVEKLARWNSAINATITDGPNGSYVYANQSIIKVPPLRTEVVGTSGAGDAFLAGVIIGLTCGMTLAKNSDEDCFAETPVDSAAELGTLLASLSVTSPDTIHQTANADLLLRYALEKEVTFSDRLKSIFDINQQ